MSDTPMRLVSVANDSAHREMHRRIVRFLADITSEMPAVEVLAIAAHIVGQLIALQDQRVMSPNQALDLVASNIDLGNAAAIRELKTKTAGSA